MPPKPKDAAWNLVFVIFETSPIFTGKMPPFQHPDVLSNSASWRKPSYQWTDHGPGHDTGISIIHLIYDRMIQGNTSTNCMGLLLWVCWDFTFDPVKCWIHCKYSRVYSDLSSHLQALYSSGMQRKNVRGKHIGVYIGHSHLVDTNVILRSEHNLFVKNHLRIY